MFINYHEWREGGRDAYHEVVDKVSKGKIVKFRLSHTKFT